MYGIPRSHEEAPAAVAHSAAAEGTVARIERLAVHDGPGIRTVVFLKGCPLRCSWCSSPETQRSEPELLLDRSRCLLCGACLTACPAGAIGRTENGEIQTDRSLCDGCGQCALTCPSGARRVVGQTVTAAQVLSEIEKDEVFYYRSGGGVTISGGEPLEQPAFTLDIAAACAARGIHTAMETSACAPWDRLDPLLDFLDLVFVDVKHMDEAAHRKATGTGNRIILENVRKLAKDRRKREVILRVPVIPGINDTEKNMEATADFARDLAAVKRLELLPYHRYGIHRYEQTGRSCGTEAVMVPTEAKLQRLASIVRTRGIPVQIGG
ncbi:MAG: glycyl-radical enzyme activating protein [Desulfobacteraceae bacterium]|nr:glycyl-radical enzyme activating protein [Desulfobacteraceae bacterium]